MRDYSKMTEEEFIKAYLTPYTESKRQELNEEFERAKANNECTELTEEVLEALLNDD